MHLYVWSSKYLEQYAPGNIIVMAPDKEGARDAARQEFERDLADRYDYAVAVKDDPDFDEMIADLRQKFESDLSREPRVIESRALFLIGSA